MRPGCAPGPAVDDERLGMFGDLRVEIVEEHAKRCLGRPGPRVEGAATRRADRGEVSDEAFDQRLGHSPWRVCDLRCWSKASSATSRRSARRAAAPQRAVLETEAPLRMLLNNLDPEVAEHPESLVVYGGSGRAARSHQALRDIVRTLLRLGDDETLLVQSGKPVGVFRTHPDAPRVLIANSLLVPAWATWDEFRGSRPQGLTMFGQMTAGSWIYIGTQGILQGTYQTFCAAGEAHFGSADLSGRTVLTAGLGGWAEPSRSRRRWRVLRSSASRSTSARSTGGSRRGTSTSRPTRSTTRSRGCGRPPRRRSPLSVALRGERGGRPAGARRPRRGFRPRHRPDGGSRPPHRLRARRGAVRGGGGAARARSRRSTSGSRPSRSSRTSARWSSSSGWGATFSIMETTCEVRPIEQA